MMFETHLSRIFNLRGRTSEKLARSSGGHCACHADLSLTTDLRTGDRGIMLDDTAEKSGCRKRTEYAFVGKAL